MGDIERTALIAEIMAAYDNAASESRPGEPLAAILVDRVTGFSWTDWSDAAMRAVLLAYASNAPDADLETMAVDTREFVAWVPEFKLQVAYEEVTGRCAYGADFTAWKQGMVQS